MDLKISPLRLFIFNTKITLFLINNNVLLRKYFIVVYKKRLELYMKNFKAVKVPIIDF